VPQAATGCHRPPEGATGRLTLWSKTPPKSMKINENPWKYVAYTSKVYTSKACPPQVRTPRMHTPELRTPQLRTHERRTPQTRTPHMSICAHIKCAHLKCVLLNRFGRLHELRQNSGSKIVSCQRVHRFVGCWMGRRQRRQPVNTLYIYIYI